MLASVEVANTRTERHQGLLGLEAIQGALLVQPARSTHTVGMRFAVDVAHLDRGMRVLRTTTMARNRVGIPVPAARAIVKAPAGSFGRWGLSEGDELEVWL